MLNIFFLHRDVKKCARYHGDKHLNVSQKELTQIASNVYHNLVRNYPDRQKSHAEILSCIYKSPKNGGGHAKHPTVLWAMKSLSHYFYVVDLGIALKDEKLRRMQNMKEFPKKLQKKWKETHKSQVVLERLKQTPPPLDWFEMGDKWEDPTPCMPECYTHDGNNNSINVRESYRLYYAGHKYSLINLRWEPFAETPRFIAKCQKYIGSRPDILKAIKDELEKKYAETESVTESSLKKRKTVDKKLLETEKKELYEKLTETFKNARIVQRKTKQFSSLCDTERTQTFQVIDLNQTVKDIGKSFSSEILLISISLKKGVLEVEVSPPHDELLFF